MRLHCMYMKEKLHAFCCICICCIYNGSLSATINGTPLKGQIQGSWESALSFFITLVIN